VPKAARPVPWTSSRHAAAGRRTADSADPINELSSLAAAVRAAAPSCTAAMLVGSAVAGRGGSVADLDVTGLDAGVPPGEDRAYQFTWSRWPVHLICYHPLHFVAVARTAELLFVFVREIRKLQDGVALFDDRGDLESTLQQLTSLTVPHHLLEPLVYNAVNFRIADTSLGRERLGLYHAVENLTYAWMHFDMRYRYSKPKWLIDDARLIPACRLLPLLEGISVELTNAHSLGRLAADMRLHAANFDDGKAIALARDNIGDAEMLLKDGREIDAVWPLRMSAYMLAQCWSERFDLPYADLRSLASVRFRLRALRHPLAEVFSDLLLLDVPVGRDLVDHWENAKVEFRSQWRRIMRKSSSNIVSAETS
jgi:hypothetical protein